MHILASCAFTVPVNRAGLDLWPAACCAPTTWQSCTIIPIVAFLLDLHDLPALVVAGISSLQFLLVFSNPGFLLLSIVPKSLKRQPQSIMSSNYGTF